MSETKLPIVDYDTHWKEIIEGLFEDFIDFFLPEASPLIDFSRPPVFLEQELHKIIPNNKKKGKAINDKLAKVYLKNGQEKWILIHIEVQANPEADFSERMFRYFYRIYDRYKQAILATAIYIGEGVPKSFGRFEYNFVGTKNVYEYNYYIIANANETELLASRNPFTLAVLAMQYLHKTKKDGDQRFAFKRKLVALAMERNYSKHQIGKLFKFVWYIMVLSEELEEKLRVEVLKETKTTDDMYIEKSRDWSNAIHVAIYGKTLDEYCEELNQASLEREKEYKAEREKEYKAKVALERKAALEREKEYKAKVALERKAALENQIKQLLRIGKLSMEEIALVSNKSLAEIQAIAETMEEE